jgi:hypothetical protein
MRYLRKRMHTRISTAGSADPGVAARDAAYRILQRLLDCPPILLRLPAAIIRSVVFDFQHYPHKMCLPQKNYRQPVHGNKYVPGRTPLFVI